MNEVKNKYLFRRVSNTQCFCLFVCLLLKLSILFHGNGNRRLHYNLILPGSKGDIYIDILYILALKRGKMCRFDFVCLYPIWLIVCLCVHVCECVW